MTTLAEMLAGLGGNSTQPTSRDRSASRNRVGPRTDLQNLLFGVDGSTAKGKRINVNNAAQAQFATGMAFSETADADRAGAIAQLEGNFDRLHQPTLTDQDIQNLFARETDAADSGSLADMGALRSALGGAGVTGGGQAFGAAARISNKRFEAVKGAKRDMKITRALTATEDRAREMQDRMALAQFQMSDRSLVGLDTLTNITDLRYQQQALGAGVDASIRSAEAMESAGDKAMFGQIAGGALGILGGALF